VPRSAGKPSNIKEIGAGGAEGIPIETMPVDLSDHPDPLSIPMVALKEGPDAHAIGPEGLEDEGPSLLGILKEFKLVQLERVAALAVMPLTGAVTA